MTLTESPTGDRTELIAVALRKWVSDLTDLGRRNTLLYYKDLRSGTLDLAAAEPAAMERLLAAKSVRLSRLFREDPPRADAIRRARTIHRKIREMAEERGINAGYLATGMARWDEPATESTTRPAAPVLLRALTLAPTRARYDDFELVLDEESEINPVLLHKLNTEFGTELDAESLKALVPSGPFDPAAVYDRLVKLANAAEVPGFAITHRQVLGTFTYAKLPMVRDLEAGAHLLAGSAAVAAVAGDPQAQAVLGAGGDGGSLPRPGPRDLPGPPADPARRDTEPHGTDHGTDDGTNDGTGLLVGEPGDRHPGDRRVFPPEDRPVVPSGDRGALATGHPGGPGDHRDRAAYADSSSGPGVRRPAPPGRGGAVPHAPHQGGHGTYDRARDLTARPGGRPATGPGAGLATGAGTALPGDPTTGPRDPAANPTAGLTADLAAGLAADLADDSADDPRQDVSVLDADSSQFAAIRAIESGQSLVVHGPPGTGKSQTIANLIATLVAGGRRVLFVAEKRAAIDAVLDRLKGVDLGDLVLDIHDGTRDRRRIARDLGATLERARQTPPPDVDWLHRRLAGRRRLLAQHVKALHEPRLPWNVTAFDVQAGLLGVPEQARTTIRLRGDALRRVDADVADRLRDELREYAHIGGFAGATNPWHGADIDSPEQAGHAHETATRLSTSILPQARGWLARAIAETGVTPPRTLTEWAALLSLYEGIRATGHTFDPAVYGRDLAAMVAATGSRKLRRARGIDMPGRTRRELVKRARALWLPPRPGEGPTRPRRPGRDELHSRLVAAEQQRLAWPGEQPPRVPTCLDQARQSHAELAAGLATLRPLVPALGPEWLGALERTLSALAADHVTPWRLPRMHALRREFAELGLDPLIEELTRREATADVAVHAFDHAWYASILDQLRIDDPTYGGLPGGTLDEIAQDFRRCDAQHLLANRARVRRATAERLRDVQDRHRTQAQLIRKQAALRRRHLPLRRLLDQAGDVLFALKPCWAMSPLMASQVLPVQRLFDVVIFDEASQVIPADAIPSIMRAEQVVVAGDSRQLPPTNFFRQMHDDADDDDESAGGVVSFDTGFESILETLEPLLPARRLDWHYRSRDERLVAFSNARIYGGTLTTFPGVFAGDCLRHEAVDQRPAAGQEHSVNAEVDRVVELILEHARTRPHESLGVIAMGAPHANRVDSALRAALAAHPRLEAFFSEDVEEPFFVKNLERVQGDERDAIILTIGYGKRADGQMRYNWGPLLRAGGERRLNVAITRAKRRLTLVSSFSSRDVDRSRVTSEGARLLCDYLEFAESGGARTVERGGPDGAHLTPFERDVRDRLAAVGIDVVPRYGIGGYRIDFAAAHPEQPGRMVLAIETDGTSYHRSRDARDRDRLRQEHLERLGWTFHRIWSTNWFLDPAAEVAKIRAAHERAVAAADATAVAVVPLDALAPEDLRGTGNPDGPGDLAGATDHDGPAAGRCAPAAGAGLDAADVEARTDASSGAGDAVVPRTGAAAGTERPADGSPPRIAGETDIADNGGPGTRQGTEGRPGSGTRAGARPPEGGSPPRRDAVGETGIAARSRPSSGTSHPRSSGTGDETGAGMAETPPGSHARRTGESGGAGDEPDTGLDPNGARGDGAAPPSSSARPRRFGWLRRSGTAPPPASSAPARGVDSGAAGFAPRDAGVGGSGTAPAGADAPAPRAAGAGARRVADSGAEVTNGTAHDSGVPGPTGHGPTGHSATGHSATGHSATGHGATGTDRGRPAGVTPITPAPVHRRLPRPEVVAGLPIAEYRHHDLVRVVHWIESDHLLRTEEETLTEVMSELGFKRRGTRIVAAITAAIATVRETRGESGRL